MKKAQNFTAILIIAILTLALPFSSFAGSSTFNQHTFYMNTDNDNSDKNNNENSSGDEDSNEDNNEAIFPTEPTFPDDNTDPICEDDAEDNIYSKEPAPEEELPSEENMNFDMPVNPVFSGTTSDELQEMIDNAEYDTVIEISKDITFTSEVIITIEQRITLSSNNKVTFLMEGSGRHFMVEGHLEFGTSDGENPSYIILDGNNSAGGIEIMLYGNAALYDNTVIQNCTADNGGGVYAAEWTSFRMANNSLIRGCTSQEKGGGIYLGEGVQFYLTDDSTVQNCTAKDGGGIFAAEYTYFQMSDNSLIQGCTADNGGGIYIIGGTQLYMSDNSAVRNCTADNGGGIYITEEATLEFQDNALIQDCIAHIRGGGIFVTEHGILNGYGGMIHSNTAQPSTGSKNGGGGIFAIGNVNLNSVTISNNKAENNYGGGIYLLNDDNRAELINCIIINNKAGIGGGIANHGMQLYLYTSDVSSNTAVDMGGGLYHGGIKNNEDPEIITPNNINKCTIEYNKARIGGGIFAFSDETTHCDLSFLGGSLSHNTAVTGGGGAKVTGIESRLSIQSEADVSHNIVTDPAGKGGGVWAENAFFETSGEPTITYNKAATGGGIYLLFTEDNPGFQHAVANAVISNNTATLNGGGIAFEISATVIDLWFRINDTVSDNYASGNGGGIYIKNTSPFSNEMILDLEIDNLELKNNTAGNNGGGIYSESYSQPIDLMITASVINNNRAERNGGGIYLASALDKLILTRDIDSIEYPEDIEIPVEVINNKAPNGFGGGIYTTDFDIPVIDSNYSNIISDPSTIFKGNTAKKTNFLDDSAFYPWIQYASLSPDDANHPVNNYDINLYDITDIYTVTFDANGGSPTPPRQTVIDGNTATRPTLSPTRNGYNFTGWHTDPSSADLYDFNTPVTGNITLYAQWKEERDDPDEGGNGGGISIPEKKTDEIEEEKEVFAEGIHDLYVYGYPDSTFRPDGFATRAEMAQILYNLSAPYDIKTHYNHFSDVTDEKSWYYEAVNYMADKGTVSGYPDSTFDPNAYITRAEFASMVARFIGFHSDGDASYPDVSPNHWATGFIAAGEELGFISGYPDGTFRPDENITRIQVVIIMNRVIDRMPIEAIFNEIDIPFTDVRRSYWGWSEIMEAATTHTSH